MAKEFYTERDIEALFARGVTALEINDNVVLTEIASEKARIMGLRLIRNKPGQPAAAPGTPALTGNTLEIGPESKLHQRIRSAVLAKLGDQIDPALVDRIIKRVLISTGVK